MSTDEQKEASRRALQLWSSSHAKTPADMVAANYANHQEPDAFGGVTTKSLEEWTDLLQSYHEAFSDSTVDVMLQIAEGDLVASHWRLTATHTGSFAGRGPTHQQSAWTGVAIDRFENGKIAESWVTWDKFSFLEGLGLVNQP